MATMTIGHYAFYNCTALEEVYINNQVKDIQTYAFASCASLKSVTISDGVNSIGNNAFLNCSNLTDIYYTGSMEKWNKISIGSNNDCLNEANKNYDYTV